MVLSLITAWRISFVSQIVASRRSLGCALGLLTIVTVATNPTPAAAGLFDFLFGGFFAPQQATPPSAQSAGTYTGYCVRLCDGRYFPVRPGATSKAVCDGLCPAAQTKVFVGSDIAQATADDGSTYQKLANAFVYRERIVPGCTCNSHSSFGTASMKIEDDPTLQPGDLVATDHGVVPAQALLRKAHAYTPIDRKLVIIAPEREPAPAAKPQRRAPSKAAGTPAAMPVSQSW
jgi:hypothetical protein